MQKSHQWPALIGVLIVLYVLVLFWGRTPANFSNPNCKFTQNAAWISVDWTSQPVDEIEVRQLAESAKSHNLKYLFPYVSYLNFYDNFFTSFLYYNYFFITFFYYYITFIIF